jgi:hypothetical protein
MVNSDYLFILPLSFPLIAVVAGVMSRRPERPYGVPLIGGALFAWIVVGVMAATTHRHGVSTTDLISGSVLSGMMLGALPVCVFFWLGRMLAGHLIVLGLICAASAVPMGFYYFIGWILTLDLTYCPPEAYECPF